MDDAKAKWRAKLEFLLAQEATAVGPSEKFAIQQEIREAEDRLRLLDGLVGLDGRPKDHTKLHSGANREDSDSPWAILQDHVKMATGKLQRAPEAFLCGLQRELAEADQGLSAQETAQGLVQWLAGCPAGEGQILAVFIAVRRALDEVPSSQAEPGYRRQAEEAACALFFLAACRLVNLAAHNAGSGSDGDSYVLLVPRSDRILCGVVATALFGGELHVIPSQSQTVPEPEYVFKVVVPAGGDDTLSDFERAAFVAICSGDRDETRIAADGGPLSPQERAKLMARIRTRRVRERKTLALVVEGLTSVQAERSLLAAQKVPVLLPRTEATRELLGMDPDTLLSEIEEFWSELHQMRNPLSGSRPQTPTTTVTPSGVQTMPPTKIELKVDGQGHTFSFGDQSQAHSHAVSQAGTGHSAQVAHQQGNVLSELLPTLKEITAAIAELPSAKARDSLGEQAAAAEAEAAKGSQANPGIIRRALEAIEAGAAMFDEGGKILDLCRKAYRTLASFFGLAGTPEP